MVAPKTYFQIRPIGDLGDYEIFSKPKSSSARNVKRKMFCACIFARVSMTIINFVNIFIQLSERFIFLLIDGDGLDDHDTQRITCGRRTLW